MTGYIAVTDFEWYTHLCRRSDWEEVNFWQPRPGNLLDPQIGTPFFFKLRKSHGSPIVGMGYFAWRSKLPAWMAWDSFGEANGAPDRASMLQRISRLRQDKQPDPAGNYEIGCLLLSNPVFFAETDWVRPPNGWPTNVQRGKTYDLSEGEGQRVYMECLQRAARYEPAEVAGAGADRHGEGAPRFGSPHTRTPRLGQGGFRVAVADVYARQCAVSTEHSLPALEAAHIRPYSEGGAHDVRNGLLLRADIHRLFDGGYVTITPDYQFRVSTRLRDDYANGRVYYELQERTTEAGRIHLPSDLSNYPDPELLDWHVREKFVDR